MIRRPAGSCSRINREGGQIIGVLMDQDTRVKGVFSPFLGHPAHTPSGPATIAARNWFDFFIGFIVQRPDDRFELRLQGPLEISRTGDLAADIRTNTDRFNELISEQILEDPSQWVWIHRRWQTKPAASNRRPARDQLIRQLRLDPLVVDQAVGRRRAVNC